MRTYLQVHGVWLSSVNALRPHAFPPFSSYQKPRALAEGALKSQGRKCGRQDVLLPCSVTGQMLTQGMYELGLTLGATAHWPHVPEASYLPTSSLDFLDSERMGHLICLTRCLRAENQVASAELSAECWAQSTPEPWGSALWPPAYLRAAWRVCRQAGRDQGLQSCLNTFYGHHHKKATRTHEKSKKSI